MLRNLKNWLGFNSVSSQVEAMLEEIKTSPKKAPAKKVAKKAPAKKAPAKKVAKKAPAKKTSGGGKGKAAL
jgi:RNA processing factor Prp31